MCRAVHAAPLPSSMRRDKCALGPLPGEAFEFEVAADGFVQPLLKPGANSTPTTVHTFWHDAGVGDATMLGVWAANWARHGWTPRVLGMAAAQRHDRFVPLCTAFAALPSFNPKSYEMNNLLRWLAVARVGGRWMADYDVSVFSRPPAKLPNEGYLTVHGGATPSVVSGKSSEFLRIAEMFAYTYDQSNNATRRRHFVVVARNGELIPHASDQSLLDVLQHRRAIKTTGWAPGEAPGLAVTRNACPEPRSTPLVAIHFSHTYTTTLLHATETERNCVCGSPWEAIFSPRAHEKHWSPDHRVKLYQACTSFFETGCLVVNDARCLPNATVTGVLRATSRTVAEDQVPVLYAFGALVFLGISFMLRRRPPWPCRSIDER